jgi:ketosteroid isomerase-like protein
MPGGLVSEVVTLSGLDASAATKMVANVIGAELPAAVAGRVLATSEGNPLFLGELVRMLVNDGVLQREGERWTVAVDLATLDMPPTIQALLAARIERLRAEDRTVLERAAVIGRQFSRSALAHLVPRESRDLDARLEALRRSELIEPDTTWFLGEPALRFHHGLTRDAAYRRLLKETRAELHGRLADWITAKVGAAIEHDELLGWHLEQAHQHLRELGPLDAHGRALGERAARHLGAAGRRALARDDVSPAATLLGRALHVLDTADPKRADLVLDWCEALLAAGDVTHAKAAIDELGSGIAGPRPGAGSDPNPQPLTPNPRLQAWHTCFADQLAVLTDPHALRTTVDALAAAAVQLAELGDHAGEAKAHQVHALALQRLGAIGAAEAVLDKALAAARSAGDRRRSNAVLAGAPQAALWGPSPVTRASGRCLDVVRVLRITQGAPAVEAVALRCQAVLEALRGRTDAAQRMIVSSRKMVEELGITQQVLETDLYIGLIAIIEDNAAAAEPSLRAAYEGFRTQGLGIDAARAAALLGHALFVLGYAAEAEALSHESEALAGDDLQAAIAWRRVRAETLAVRGEHASAVAIARTAVEIAGATDALLLHGNARMALTAALRADGRREEAATEQARAIELWEAKGATLLVERARGSASAPARRFPLPLGEGQGGGKLAEASQSDRPHPSPLPGGEGAERGLSLRRHVRPNAATANARRFDAAIAARDATALANLLASDTEVVDHTTGATYGRDGVLLPFQKFATQNIAHRLDPLATLGDSLALFRMSASLVAFVADDFDVGAVEMEKIVLIEVDADERQCRVEFFVLDRLGDAVVRLFERYAERLPDGPERTRATATARSLAAHLGALDLERMVTPLALGVQDLDHRTAGFGSVQGIDGFRAALRTLFEGADDVANRVDDVLDLRLEGLVLRITNSGTLRVGGGTYERPFVMLWVSGVDGRVTHIEQFDVGHESEALARFDELTVTGFLLFPGEGQGEGKRAEASQPDRPHPSPLPGGEGVERPSGSPLGKGRIEEASRLRRRVRPNAATALIERGQPLMAARDLDAVAALWADDIRYLHGPAGVVLGREEMRAWMRLHFEDRDATLHAENIATLGDSLALQRATWSGSMSVDPDYPVGAFERRYFQFCQVDAQGRMREGESFAPDRLADAIARLYERHAALIPDGPERVRSAANARFVVRFARGPEETLDPAGASALAPDIEVVDHRTLGTWSMRGRETLVQNIRVWRDVAEHATVRADDVLALRPDALLARWLHAGTDRASGGVYERPALLLWIVGADGRMTRWEFFEPDDEAEALARFDELGDPSVSPLGKGSIEAESPTARFANVASRSEERMLACWAARDWAGVMAFYSPALRFDDRRRLVRLEIGAEDFVAQYRMLFDQPRSRWHEPLLATRGERLSLHRVLYQAEAAADGGPLEFEEHLALIEVDTEGRQVGIVVFDLDARDAAYAEFDARWEAGEAAVHPRASAWIAAFRRAFATRDWEAMAALHAPDQVAHNHRLVGWTTLRGPRAWIAPLEQLVELAPDVRLRIDHLRTCERGFLFHYSWQATREGGEFDTPQLLVVELDDQGRQRRLDVWDCEAVDAAFARFAEIGGSRGVRELAPAFPDDVDESGGKPHARSDPVRIPPNAATRAIECRRAAFEAKDWEAFRALCAPTLLFEDRRRGMRLAGDLDMFMASNRLVAESGARAVPNVLATAGDHLALERMLFARTDGGAEFEVEALRVSEVDAAGRLVATIFFDPDDRRAAALEMLERYGRSFSAAYLEGLRAVNAHDVDRMATILSDDFVMIDHRWTGLGRLNAKEYLASLAALFEEAPDVTVETLYTVAVDPRGALVVARNFGTLREGGAFESIYVRIGLIRGDRITRVEMFEPEDLDRARARFAELRAADA